METRSSLVSENREKIVGVFALVTIHFLILTSLISERFPIAVVGGILTTTVLIALPQGTLHRVRLSSVDWIILLLLAGDALFASVHAPIQTLVSPVLARLALNFCVFILGRVSVSTLGAPTVVGFSAVVACIVSVLQITFVFIRSVSGDLQGISDDQLKRFLSSTLGAAPPNEWMTIFIGYLSLTWAAAANACDIHRWRLSAGGAVVITTLAAILSLSRGIQVAVLVLGIVVLCVVFFSAAHRRYWFSIAAIIIVVTTVVFTSVPVFRRAIVHGTGFSSASVNLGSYQGRLKAWQDAFSLIQKSPWKGVGAGHYALHAAPLSVDRPTRAMNGFAEFAVERGLPFTLVFLGVPMIGLGVVATRSWHRRKAKERSLFDIQHFGGPVLRVCIGAGLLALVVRELTFTVVTVNPAVSCMFILLITILIRNRFIEDTRDASPIAWQLIFTVIAFTLVSVGVYREARLRTIWARVSNIQQLISDRTKAEEVGPILSQLRRIDPANAYLAAIEGLLAERRLPFLDLRNWPSISPLAGGVDVDGLLASENSYTSAIEQSPAPAIYFHNRAWLRARSGRWSQAFSDIEAALQSEPRNWLILVSSGMFSEANKKFDEARESFSRAVAQNPRLLDSYLIRRLPQHVIQSIRTRAVNIIEAELAKAKSPKRIAALGSLYFSAGDWSSSRQYLEEALKELPGLTRPLALLGIMQLKGDYDKAFDLCQKAVLLDSTDRLAIACLTTVVHKKNTPLSASLTRIVQSAPTSPASSHVEYINFLYGVPAMVRNDIVPIGLLFFTDGDLWRAKNLHTPVPANLSTAKEPAMQ